jgi:hypothetical protein
MTVLLGLSGAATLLTIWVYHHRLFGANDLGSVSARWLHEYRSDSHQQR